jgi:hypothetical protein
MSSQVKQWYRRLRYGKPIIVVSGLPRSGTSMAMKMLEAAGIPLVVDGVRVADEDNPKGYYELERVKDLQEEKNKSWLRNARGQAVKIVSSLLSSLPPENNYRVIFMKRNLEEVLASQAKMLERRGEQSQTSDDDLREMYVAHLEKTRFLLRYREQFEWIEVPYSGVVGSPLEQARRISEFLGAGLDVERMAAVVDSKLYRNRADSAPKS